MENFDFKKYLAEGRLLKEELTPLQQYVYNYEKDVSGEDEANNFLDGIKNLNTPQDVYDYYAIDRGWEGSDLENISKQVKRKFANLASNDGLTDLQRRAYSYAKERFGNDEAKKSLDQIKTFKTPKEFTDWVYQKIEIMENFDLKKFLVENKLTENSKALSEINTLAEADGKGIVITSSNQLAELLTETVGDTGSFEVSISQSPAEFSDYLDKNARKGRNGKLSVIKSPADLADTLTIWCRDNNYDKITYVPVGEMNRVGYLKAVNTKVEHAENIFMEVYPNSQ